MQLNCIEQNFLYMLVVPGKKKKVMRNQKHKAISIISTEANFGLRQAGIFIGHVKVTMFRMQTCDSSPHNLTKTLHEQNG